MESPSEHLVCTQDSYHSLYQQASLMQAPPHNSSSTQSLRAMAIRCAQRHIREVTDLGDARYDLVKPLIDSVTYPQQLLTLQKASPQIAEFTGYKWIEFLKRDVPSWMRSPVFPEKEELWWQVYQRAKHDYNRKIAESEALLIKANAITAAEKASNKSRYDSTLLYAPDDTKILRGHKPAPSKPKPHSSIMTAVMKESAQAGRNRPRQPQYKTTTASNRGEQPCPAGLRGKVSKTTIVKQCNKQLAQEHRQRGAQIEAARVKSIEAARQKVLAGLKRIQVQKDPLDEEAAMREVEAARSPVGSDQEVVSPARAVGEPAPLYSPVTAPAKRVRAEASCFVPAKRQRRN